MPFSRIEVRLPAVAQNARYFKGLLKPETKFMAVVKGNAYGHGVIPCTRVLAEAGASYLGVAFVQEGIELRQNGFSQPILVLGHPSPDEYPSLIQYNLMPTLSTLEQAQALGQFAQSHGDTITAHLKVDTGMGRLGLLVQPDTTETIQKILKVPGLEVEGIFSHLATAPQVSNPKSCLDQFGLFQGLLEELEREKIQFPLRHICNSAATILYPEMHLDMVRVGTSLYGLYPGSEMIARPGFELYPALEIKSALSYVRNVPVGTHVSYDGNFEAKRPSILGAVPMGYVDGIARNVFANGGEVLVHGQRCRIVGNICMDQFMVDLTDLSESPQMGDEVVLIGRQGSEFISAEEAGQMAGTISIEVICRAGRRTPMVHL